MNEKDAKIISTWMYPQPYNIYDMDGSEECINELMNGDYFCAKDNKEQIIAFMCSGKSARVPGGNEIGIYNNPEIIDIGLGLRPDLTGRGLGSHFLKEAISFISKRNNKSEFQLVVAAFNERAIRAYEKAGFQRKELFHSKVADFNIPFLAMRYNIPERE
ncbi:GNAT family N-acetyltransferase [Paenibacillus tarimensis]